MLHFRSAFKYRTRKDAKDWFLDETGGWPLSRTPPQNDTNQQVDYERLWSTLSPYFWRVQEGTFESANFNEADVYKLRERPKAKHKHASRRAATLTTQR